MRKVSFVLAVGLALVACGGDETPPPKAPEPPPPAVTTPPVATVEAPKEEPKKEPLDKLIMKTMMAWGAAMNAHDSKKLASLYSESAVVKVAGAPQDASGRDAIATSYQKLFDAFPDYKMAPSRIWAKDDVGVDEWAFTGTHTGDLWGMKATEKKVGVNGLDVIWFTPDGEIKEHHVYYDGATMLSQIGVAKQKVRPIPTLPAKPEFTRSAGTPDEAKNIEVVKGMTGALEAKKEADFVGPMADTLEWDDLTQAQTMKGKDSAKKYFKEMTTAFPDGKHAVVYALGVGDYVITEGTMNGTSKAPFFGIPASKKPVSTRFADVYQMKDGKVVHGWSYSNGADFLMQLGVIKPPAAPKPAAKPADAKPAAAPAPAKK